MSTIQEREKLKHPKTRRTTHKQTQQQTTQRRRVRAPTNPERHRPETQTPNARKQRCTMKKKLSFKMHDDDVEQTCSPKPRNSKIRRG